MIISDHANTIPPLADALRSAFGEVRAEYESDDELFARFSEPLYLDRLLGMAPAFLVGGRGTGKTTVLRSMSFRGQSRITGSRVPEEWRVIGAYWKAEPNVVSAFRGKGLEDEAWSSVFAHYLNLRLSALVLDYARWTQSDGSDSASLDPGLCLVFCRSLHLSDVSTLEELAYEVNLQLVEIENRLNGSVRSLTSLPMSLLGRPLDYLFEAIRPRGVSQTRPFVFCIDEYENLESYQQVLVNTLVKAVGSSSFTLKVGVRAATGIVRETLIAGQPLQDPADFITVDIVRHLKDENFDTFAETVVMQRLERVGHPHLSLAELLPALPMEEEVSLLGGASMRDEILASVESAPGIAESDIAFAANLPLVQLALIRYWARAHDESEAVVLQFAQANPKKWSTRVGNHSFEMLFTLHQNSVGIRKYYSGWRTYCQLAEGNIRYLLRVTYEALRLHVSNGATLTQPVLHATQTEAAKRAGETTLRELQGWSREGGALTRLTLGLGRIFGGLAREISSTTPEVNQFRVRFTLGGGATDEVEKLLAEAVGQGVVIDFDGDKNARLSGATREKDYQLHPIFAAYFTYSQRSKRRMTIASEDLLTMTTRQSSPTIRRLLATRGIGHQAVPDQLRIFEDGLDGGP